VRFHGGQAHATCKQRRALPLANGGSSSHKRRRSNSPSTPSSVQTKRPRRHREITTQRTWPTHEWQLHAPTVESATLAHRWKAFYDTVASAPRKWHGISGHVKQLDALACAAASSLVSDTASAHRGLFDRMQLEHASLHLVAAKLLRAAPGVGLQPVHFDVRDRADAERCVAVILYCVATDSTAVPRDDAETMRPAFADSDRGSAHERQRVADLSAPRRFTSVPVQAGHVLVFRTTVAHHGVANAHATDDRIALFLLFSPHQGDGQDRTQRYPVGRW
jgi:hypothetical protein